MFSSLPLDVLPLIIDGLTKRSHIASACLVSRPFYDVAVILLYRVISVYAWHKDGKSKTIQLFTVLAENASLARYVRVLELRDFPKAQIGQYSKHEALLRLTVAGLRNCSFLRSCTWTRDGTLDSSILEALANLSGLRSLEINGHDSGNYDASILLRFPHLDKLSFIMPSARIAHQLPLWTQSHSGQLRHLTLICKSSSVVSDQLLISLAPNLASLESLYLTGCVKITEDGVLTLLSFNHAGIRNLGLEGVSTQFNMKRFSDLCTEARYFRRLRSCTFTLGNQAGRAQITHPWILHLQNLLKPVHTLCFLQIYASTPDIDPESIDGLLKDLALTHGPTLLRFSVHRIVMKPDTIQHIVSSCPLLEELFVVLQPRFLNTIGACLSQGQNLRTVHINSPVEDQDADRLPVLRPEEALRIVERCSSSIQLFGFNTRVWQVKREIIPGPSGLSVRRLLTGYEGNQIPEAFTVVRT